MSRIIFPDFKEFGIMVLFSTDIFKGRKRERRRREDEKEEKEKREGEEEEKEEEEDKLYDDNDDKHS